jgi:predicted dehydrogenase
MLARERVELVSVCSPVSSHTAILSDVLDSRNVTGVLLEKPIGMDSADAEAAVQMVDKSAAKVAVNYVRRYVPAYIEVAEWVSAGYLGEIQKVRGFYTKGVLNNGSHMLDLLRFFWGDPEGLEVLGGLPEPGQDPTLSFRACFEKGVEAFVFGVNQRAFNIFEIDVLGSRGRVVFSDLGHLRETYSRQDTKKAHGFRQLSPRPEVAPTSLGDGTRFAIENLIESIEADRAPRCTVHDARAALSLSLELIRSAAPERAPDPGASA